MNIHNLLESREDQLPSPCCLQLVNQHGRLDRMLNNKYKPHWQCDTDTCWCHCSCLGKQWVPAPAWSCLLVTHSVAELHQLPLRLSLSWAPLMFEWIKTFSASSGLMFLYTVHVLPQPSSSFLSNQQQYNETAFMKGCPLGVKSLPERGGTISALLVTSNSQHAD